MLPAVIPTQNVLLALPTCTRHAFNGSTVSSTITTGKDIWLGDNPRIPDSNSRQLNGWCDSDETLEVFTEFSRNHAVDLIVND